VAGYRTEDLCFRKLDDRELLGRLYRPEAGGPVPYVIDAHGGAWSSGDRMNNSNIHEVFAANGIGVFALDFRLAGEAPFPAPVQDVNFGVRWFKANAQRLGVAAGVIGGLGSSSGGQQMGMVAFRPADPDYAVSDPALEGVDASLAFFVGCWPILDPLARYRMAQATGKQRLAEATETYFGDEAAMRTGNPFLIVEGGRATHLPPMVVVQGTADDNVEHERADMFAEAYRAAGGSIEVHKYDGQPHNFIKANAGSDAANKAIEVMQAFVLSRAR